MNDFTNSIIQDTKKLSYSVYLDVEQLNKKEKTINNDINHNTGEHVGLNGSNGSNGLNRLNRSNSDVKKLSVESRKISKWVEDSSVIQCFNCKNEFSMLLRKHHCRLCGRVFCYQCSNYYTTLPLDILRKVPDKPSTYNDYMGYHDDLNKNVRVCGTCFSYVNNLIRLRKIIKVFEMCEFDIKELMLLSKLNKDWMEASKFCLSKFREIQYKLSIEDMTPTEKRCVWINRNYLTGHSRWLVQLVKATNFNSEKDVKILEDLMYKNKVNKCWDTMCTRFCSEKIGMVDILDLIRFNRNNPVISAFITKCLNETDLSELKFYLPFLIVNLNNNKYMLDVLLFKAKDDFDFMNSLYWGVKVYCTDYDMRKKHIFQILVFIKCKTSKEFKCRFKNMLDAGSFSREISPSPSASSLNTLNVSGTSNSSNTPNTPNTLSTLSTLSTLNTMNTINPLHSSTVSIIDKKPNHDTSSTQNQINHLKELNKKDTIVMPLFPGIDFKSIDINEIKTMNSNSKPIIIPFIDSNGDTRRVMYKKDDIRKDHIILNIIEIIHNILKKEENMDIDTVKYDCMPISENYGYIEIVEDASTIFNILEYSGFTIQNYIMEYNKDLSIGEFRERFIKSTALYCVLSYLLGIGDRHLDNIMISKTGLLFHIDFGYILGQDPKYSNNKLIRVTPEIVNVIGGYQSEDYVYFKKCCTRIYNRLRLHVNLFSNLLSVIPEIDPQFNLEMIKREIINRFEVGENCIEAETHMSQKVDSDKNNFEYVIIDFLYRSKNTSVYKGLSYVTGSIFNIFQS